MANNVLDTFEVEQWHCYDERLPKTKDLNRIPPDQNFIDEILEHGLLQPIMMGYNEKEGWFLVFGRKRLMAIRSNNDLERSNGIVLVRVANITKMHGHVLSMVENAQRSKNPISDYHDIQAILRKDRKATYKSIAEQVGVPVTYVKTLDQTFGRVPAWALKGALADKISESVIKEVGKLPIALQKEAEEFFNDKGTLPMSRIDEMKRFKREEFSAKFEQAPGMNAFATVSSGRDFIPAEELDEVKKLLEAKNYKAALASLNLILEK